MSNEVLKVVGTADMSNLTRGLDEAKRGLSQTATETLKTERALSRLSGSVKDPVSSLNNLGSAVSRTNEGLKKSVPGSNQASYALLNLGRVAQDAPFGFIGIANNLNPLLESFQRLQQTSGSTGGALKALGATLLGPAGIGVALSVVSSLFISFGSQISDFFNSVTNAEKAQRSLNKALSEAEASVAGNVSRLKALVSIAQDVNNSDAKRKEAIGALNKEYDVFNKQLDLSNINTSFATALIDKQTQALIRQAKIRGVENLIAKTTEKRFEILNGKLTDNLTLWDNIKSSAIGGLNIQSGVSFVLSKGLERTNQALAKNTEETSFYEAELRKLLDTDAAAGTLFKESEKKVKSFTSTIKAAAKDLSIPFKKISFKPQNGELDVDFGPIPFEEALAAKIARESINKGTLVFPIPVQPKLEFINGLPTTLQELDELQKIAFLKSAGVTTGIQDGLRVGIEGLRFPQLTALYDSFKTKFEGFTQLINSSIENIAEGSLANLGEAIGNVLSGNDSGLKGLFDGIFTTVGDQIQQLGKFLIQSGVQISIAKKAFGKLLANPLASIAVGVGLVALGALIKNAVGKKPQGFATGTRNYQGGSVLVGERGPELLTIPSGSAITPNAQTNSILNGAGGNNFVASYVLRGQDLVTVISRTNKSNGRMGFGS